MTETRVFFLNECVNQTNQTSNTSKYYITSEFYEQFNINKNFGLQNYIYKDLNLTVFSLESQLGIHA